MKRGTKRVTSLGIALFLTLGLTACSQPKHVHVFEGDYTVTVEATCTEPGSEERTCECGEKQIKKIAALGHVEKYQLDTKVQTCLEGGYNLYFICERCGYNSKKELPPLGHTGTKQNAKEATCTTRGWDAYETCTRCEYTTRGNSYAAFGHTFANGVCSVCQTQASDGLAFEKTDDGVVVTGCNDSRATQYVIPSEYDGGRVVGIADEAFKIGSGQTSAITTIDIPKTVTLIGKSAFSDNTRLRYLTIGWGVKEIGANAFTGCTALVTIDIPDSVETINSNAFANCTSLSSVTIGSGVKSIGTAIFTGCTKLTQVTYWGTKAEWNEAVKKKLGVTVTVHCLDGDLKF